MKNLALAHIQEMDPYSPPLDGRVAFAAAGGLLLDFNESTLGLPTPPDLPGGTQAHLYPEYGDLTERVAEYAGIAPEQVMVVNGTDQAINVTVRTFADRDDGVVIPEPTFTMFEREARISRNTIVSPSYDQDTLAFPTQQVLDAIDDKTKLVVVCNPNNPTGTLASTEDIERIAEKASDTAIVYVDEAYFEFSGETAVPLIEKHPNIIVGRTFSKALALAGLRIGYVVANQTYIKEMLKVRGPYDVNQVASDAARLALSQVGAVRSYADEVMGEAKPRVEKFFDEQGVVRWPSGGNFVLFKPEQGAERIARGLREAGILLRPQHRPPIEETLRVTIGTVKQMERFMDTYATVIKNIRQQRSD